MIDMFASATFWLGLAQIAYLNLLLSGDNALVIALAVRTLPKGQRVLGQVWGAVGAVALRLAFLTIVMYLLEVRFLRLIGGLLLIWIAFKLVQSESGVESEVKGGASLWEAIWIITVADVKMSLDNVLAVAAAARNDLVLIMFGIGLSLPIVVLGAGWLARLMNRYAWIIWLGGGILGKVAAEMILDDRVVRDFPWAHAWDRALPGGLSVNLHPFPLGLGAVLAVLGWWLGRGTRHHVPEKL
jgi:YjbE family integral membrane protein